MKQLLAHVLKAAGNSSIHSRPVQPAGTSLAGTRSINVMHPAVLEMAAVVLAICALVGLVAFHAWSSRQSPGNRQAGDDAEVKERNTEVEKRVTCSFAARVDHAQKSVKGKRVPDAVWGALGQMSAFKNLSGLGAPNGYVKFECDVLLQTMGLSGMCLLDLHQSAGVSGSSFRITLPLIAIQAWIIQFVILGFMAVQLSNPREPGKPHMPYSIVFAAIYLHFLNCTSDLPFSLSVIPHFFKLHRLLIDRAIALPIFAMDAFIVPLSSMVIGSLYLCTSETVGDVILNSCAVAFIGNIDNWILGMNESMNRLGGAEPSEDLEDPEDVGSMSSAGSSVAQALYLPVNRQFVKIMSWAMCIVPVIPTLFAGTIMELGLDFLHL